MGPWAQGAWMDPPAQSTKPSLVAIACGDVRLLSPLVHHEKRAVMNQIPRDAMKEFFWREEREGEPPGQDRRGRHEWKPCGDHVDLFFQCAVVGHHEGRVRKICDISGGGVVTTVFNHDEPLASGLVLSDGSILSAAAILEGNALRTSKGRLLVLSACQTGVNVVTEGGEILGLARALMYAGMPNLVLSLWEVADRSTSELMQDFHQSLLAGWQAGKGSIADALRQAQLKAIAERQPIHAWAPFIHFGID